MKNRDILNFVESRMRNYKPVYLEKKIASTAR